MKKFSNTSNTCCQYTRVQTEPIQIGNTCCQQIRVQTVPLQRGNTCCQQTRVQIEPVKINLFPIHYLRLVSSYAFQFPAIL